MNSTGYLTFIFRKVWQPSAFQGLLVVTTETERAQRNATTPHRQKVEARLKFGFKAIIRKGPTWDAVCYLSWSHLISYYSSYYQLISDQSCCCSITFRGIVLSIHFDIPNSIGGMMVILKALMFILGYPGYLRLRARLPMSFVNYKHAILGEAKITVLQCLIHLFIMQGCNWRPSSYQAFLVFFF